MRLADAAYKGLLGELHDDQNGGWYAGLAADGKIVPSKQCYAHAFVILAACSGVLAGREGAKNIPGLRMMLGPKVLLPFESGNDVSKLWDNIRNISGKC